MAVLFRMMFSLALLAGLVWVSLDLFAYALSAKAFGEATINISRFGVATFVVGALGMGMVCFWEKRHGELELEQQGGER